MTKERGFLNVGLAAVSSKLTNTSSTALKWLGRVSENAVLQLNAPVAAGADTSAGEHLWKEPTAGFLPTE